MKTGKLFKYNRFVIKHRLLIFLVLLLLLLVIFPFVYEYLAQLLGVLEILFAAILMMGIYILSTNRELLTVSFFLATMTLTVVWFNVLLSNVNLMIFGLVLQISFFALTTFVLLAHVLTYKRVTADKIYGTISGYLLLGIMWSMIYTIIEYLAPGSFVFHTDPYDITYYDPGNPFNFVRFIYYSFVTLTTTGYGDITPFSPPARIFSAFEAIIGQLYIAVLISRIVGLHIGHTMLRKR